MKKLIHARISIKADSLAAFQVAVQTMIAATRAESGCLSYELLADTERSGEFLFVEQWEDQAAIDAHFAAPHFQSFGETLAKLSAAPMRATIFTIAEEQKL